MSQKKAIKNLSHSLSIIIGSALACGTVQAANPVKIGGTEIKVSGYIKADMIYSDVDSSAGGNVPLGNQLFIGPLIPLEGSEAADQSDLTMHARQSRLIVTTKTGDLKTKIEGDFFGSDGDERFSNSNDFRIRVAWAEFGNWGFGQNWTAAAIFPAFAEQLNFSGFSGGYTPIRQTGIRYSSGSWVFALENPETSAYSIDEPNGLPALQGTDDFPDVVARYNKKGAFGAMQTAVVLRKLSDSSGDLTDTGVGLIIGGTLKLGAKNDLKFLLGHGSLGRFMSDGLVAADAQIVNGELEAVDITSGHVAYRHFWGKGVRSTLLYSAAEADYNDAFNSSNITKSSTTVMANLLWDTTPKTTVGIEISNHEREVESGATGELNRVQFSLQQKF